MELQIDAARREGTTLILTTKDAARFMYHFHPGLFSIDKAKKKRSLDANAYLWVLVGKIAAAVGIPTDEVYRNAIRDAGEFTPLPFVPQMPLKSSPASGGRRGQDGLLIYSTIPNSPDISL